MKTKRIVVLLSLVLIIITLVVYLCVINCSFFYTDDYATTYDRGQINTAYSVFATALHEVKDCHLNVNGCYFSNFLRVLFDPFLYEGFSSLHIVLSLNFCFLLISILFFSVLLSYEMGSDRFFSFVMATGIVWSFFNYRVWTEVLFWFTGAMAYSVPFACCLNMVSFLMIGHNKKSRLAYVVSIIFGIGAMGGVESVAFGGCFILLLLFIKWLKNHTLEKFEILIFAIVVVAGLINCLAPGGFKRATLYDSNVNVFTAFLYASRSMIIQLEQLLKDTGFPIILLVSFLCGIISKEGYLKQNIVRSLLYIMISVFFVFPAVLGYNSPYMPNRILFLGDFFLISGFVILTYTIGQRIAKSQKNEILLQALKVNVAVITIIVAVVLPYRIEDGEVYLLGKAYLSGDIKAYYSKIVDINEQCRMSKGEDVVVTLPEPIDGFLEFLMDTDPDYWINKEIQSCYGNKSVRSTTKPLMLQE